MGVTLEGFKTSIIVVTARGGTDTGAALRAGETARFDGVDKSLGGDPYRGFFSRLSVSSLVGDDAVGRFRPDEVVLATGLPISGLGRETTGDLIGNG